MPELNRKSNLQIVRAVDPEFGRLQAQIDQLRKAADDMSAQLSKQLEARVKPPAGKAEVLAAVKAAGHLTVAQLMSACQLQKSSAWHHLNTLEREGAVWFRQTHRPDGRKHTVIYHADAIAT